MSSIPFIGSSYRARSPAVDCQECINFYPEISRPQEQAKSVVALYPTPGLTLFNKNEQAQGIVRCVYTTSTNRMFAVIGSQLIEYSILGKGVSRGTLKTSVGHVSMTDCGNGAGRGFGLCIVDGIYGYNYNLSNNILQQITDPSFPKYPGTVLFMQGFFVVNELNTAKFWYSQQYDCLDWGDIQAQYLTEAYIPMQNGVVSLLLEFQTGLPALNDANITAGMWTTITSASAYLSGIITSYDPATGYITMNVQNHGGASNSNQWSVNFYQGSTRFYTAEGLPDNIKTITSIRNDLWIIGELSVEIWYNPPGYDINNPFIRRTTFMNNGTVAPHSIATNGDNLFWLGSSASGFGQIWMTNNYTPTKISTNAIDHMIESLQGVEDATGWCYTQEGHGFYVVNFTRGNRTFVYDLSTDEWSERADWDGPRGKFNRYVGDCQCFFNDMNFVGDYRNANIYKLDLNVYTDNGKIVRRVRTGPHIHYDRKRIYFSEFEVDIERGIGLDGLNASAAEPEAFLTFSDDGGFTWSNEYWLPFGGRGQYKTRLHCHRLGYSRDRIFRLTVCSPTKMVLIGARADFTIESAGAPQKLNQG